MAVQMDILSQKPKWQEHFKFREQERQGLSKTHWQKSKQKRTGTGDNECDAEL